jgi:hypothetical protein
LANTNSLRQKTTSVEEGNSTLLTPPLDSHDTARPCQPTPALKPQKRSHPETVLCTGARTAGMKVTEAPLHSQSNARVDSERRAEANALEGTMRHAQRSS